MVLPPPVKEPYTYLVGAGDVLAIDVYDEPNLQVETTVTPDGHLSVPLIGQLEVQDRTLPEIEALLLAELRELITEPAVHVSLVESRSSQVQLVGQVGAQGPVLFQDRLSVVQAIGEAGGIRWESAQIGDIRIVRGPLDDPVVIAVDLTRLFAGQGKDVFLQPGDIVYVPETGLAKFDRAVGQILAPIRNIAGATRDAALVGVSPP